MTRRRLFAAPAAAALAVIVGVGSVEARVAAYPKPKPRLPAVVRTLVRDGAPGALAVVRTPTRIRRAAAGLSSRDPRVSLRSTQHFRVASITKSFVATVVLQLVGEGKLSLGDSVERWLPGLVPNGGAITVRELLNHTSGLFDYTDDPDFNQIQVSDAARVFSPRELVAIATSHEPLFAPDSGWSYSNTNYVVLGLVVEAVTAATLEQQLRQRIIEPLRLTATSFPRGSEVPANLVHGFIGSATLPIPTGTLIDVTSALNASWFWGAGGIVSDADDVSRFYAALLGGRLLRPDLLVAMRTVVRSSQYGLGLMRVVTDCGVAFGHLGDFIAYRTVAYARPDGRRVAVVMVNIDTTHVQWATLEAAAETAFCKG